MDGATDKDGLPRGDALIRLRHWLGDRIGEFDQLELSKLSGGQSNPTFLIKTDAGNFVLRRKPFGQLLPRAHMVEREYRVLTALAATDVPVPRTIGLCEDAALIGAPFFIMEHIEGRIEMDARLPTMSPTDRGAVFDQMNATIAKLHAVDIASVGLANYGKPENFLERQIALWTQQYKAAQTVDITAMDRLMTWLPNNRPPRSNVSLFHGDFRLDNMILHPREPVVQAVIDWELSTLGDPLADLAYNALIWHIPPDLFRGLKGSSIAGIPSEDDYLSAYCRRLGRSEIAHWPFYLAFSLFRITAIVQGIAKRAQDATANADDAAELGKRAAPLAEIGWSLASR